ncbi:MAG: ester cyclase [Calditrichota bacterium]
MSTESHKTAVRRYCEELFTHGRLEVIDEVLTDTFVFNGPFGRLHGPEEFKRFVIMLRDAFEDFRMTDELDIAEGDLVASRFVMSGRHRGNYHGIPGTGNPMFVHGIDIFRFEGSKIAEVSAVIDSLKMMQQLGVVAVQG